MSDDQSLANGRLSRQDLLKLAALGGGAALLGGPAGAAEAALSRLAADSGRLQVLDWDGYQVPQLYEPYLKKYPKPTFLPYMTSETNALTRIAAGSVKPDVVRPYVGYVRDFAESGFTQPWNPKLITNLKHLNPSMVAAGRYKGKQYGIPLDWGFDSVLYRTDKVHPKAQSWGLLFDERYKGKISWWDDFYMVAMTGFYLGFKDPWNQSDSELDQSVKLLASKKHLVKLFWASETDMQTAFAAGDIWIAYAWPADWVAMKKKGLKVRYMHPKEGPISWVGMFMLGKDTPRYDQAHAYADAWASKQSGTWLEDNYGYGHSNTLARPKSSDLLKALQLTNPNALQEPNAHIDRFIPRRELYNHLWQTKVKA